MRTATANGLGPKSDGPYFAVPGLAKLPRLGHIEIRTATATATGQDVLKHLQRVIYTDHVIEIGNEEKTRFQMLLWKRNYQKEKLTAPGIPRRSPIQVLTGPDVA